MIKAHRDLQDHQDHQVVLEKQDNVGSLEVEEHLDSQEQMVAQVCENIISICFTVISSSYIYLCDDHLMVIS